MNSHNEMEKNHCTDTDQWVNITSKIKIITPGNLKLPIEIRCSRQNECEIYDAKNPSIHCCPTLDIVWKRYRSQFSRKN